MNFENFGGPPIVDSDGEGILGDYDLDGGEGDTMMERIPLNLGNYDFSGKMGQHHGVLDPNDLDPPMRPPMFTFGGTPNESDQANSYGQDSIGYSPPGGQGEPGGYGPPGTFGPPGGYEVPGGHGTPGAFGAPGGYGSPGGYGASGAFGAPEGYGTPGGHGAPGAFGAPGGFETPGGYETPGGQGALGGYGTSGGQGAPGAFGLPGGYGTPGGHGTPGEQGGPGGYGTPSGQGAPGGYGTPGGQGAPGGYGTPGGQGGPSGRGRPSGYGTPGGHEAPTPGRSAPLSAQPSGVGSSESASNPQENKPARPRRQLKEKFMKDREKLEADLNRKGASLYDKQVKKQREEQPNPYANMGGWGAPPAAGWSGVDPRAQPYNWGGGPPPYTFMGPGNASWTPPQQQQAPEPDQPDPFYEAEKEVKAKQSSYKKDPFSEFSEEDRKEFMEIEKDNKPGADNAEYGIGDGTFQPFEDEDGYYTEHGYESKHVNEGGDNEVNPIFDIDDKEFRGEGGGVSEFSFEEATNKAAAAGTGSEDMTAMPPVAAGGLEKGEDRSEGAETGAVTPQRPQRRLKEKFMKDREHLEAMLNAKGQSLYRSKAAPKEEPAAEGVPGGYGGPMGPYGGPGGRSFMGPEQLRAQMALQQIAKAALKASAMRGKRGKRSGPQYVFL